jgi:hypothetical protein
MTTFIVLDRLIESASLARVILDPQLKGILSPQRDPQPSKGSSAQRDPMTDKTQEQKEEAQMRQLYEALGMSTKTIEAAIRLRRLTPMREARNALALKLSWVRRPRTR